MCHLFIPSNQGVDQRGRSAPVARTHSFSLTLAQPQNNPLLRKDEHIVSPELCVTSARLVSGLLFYGGQKCFRKSQLMFI